MSKLEIGGFIGIVLAIFLIDPLLIKIPWNYLQPVLNTKPLNYMQAFALLILCKTLFSSYGKKS